MIEFLIYKGILIGAIFGITLGIAAYSTYAERKVAAFLQDRIGPDRAGPFGLLQPIADGVKMFLKEEIIPTVSDRLLFIMGPCIFMITALMTSAVIPWGLPLHFGETTFSLQVADINIGILYIFGVISLGVYGIMIGEKKGTHWIFFPQPLGFLIFLICPFPKCTRSPFALPKPNRSWWAATTP